MLTEFSPRLWPIGLAAAYLALAVAYGLANPPFEATDEIRHFRYIRYLRQERALPPISAEASAQLQAHHPPLYYALAAAITAPISTAAGPDYAPPINPFWGFRYFEPSFDNKAQYVHAPDSRGPTASGTNLIVFAARWLSTVFGLGVLAGAYRLGRVLEPNRPGVALTATALVAFNPALLHAASSLNNDAAVACFGAWAIAECAEIARAGMRPGRGARLGLALGLALLTKASALVLVLLAVAVALMGWRSRRSGTGGAVAQSAGQPGWAGWSGWALAAAICLLTSGWWFARNYLLSGDLMGFSDYQAAWVGEADRARLVREAFSGLPYAWTTLWGRFDYGQVVLPGSAYWLWAVVCAIALVGLGRAWRQLAGYAVPMLALGLALAGWAALMVTIPATAHARHVLYAYPALGFLLSVGLAHALPSRLPGGVEANRLPPPKITAPASLAFALYALLAWLAPAFAYPRSLASLPPEAVPVHATFEQAAELAGFRLQAAPLTPGAQLDVTVYWLPLAQTAEPLQVFVHLVDSQGIIAAQRDTYPGLGNAVTTAWRTGHLFADTYRVFVPETAYAPESLTVRVGLWSVGEARPLLAGDADAVSLGVLPLAQRPGPWPNPVGMEFDEGITLVGYDLDSRVLRAGQTFTLQTHFSVQSRPAVDYWAYAHVVGADGRIWALADSVILPPTSQWDADRPNGEARPITLAADTPPGQYVLEFGLSRVTDNRQFRLPLLEDGRPAGDHIDLARLRVAP